MHGPVTPKSVNRALRKQINHLHGKEATTTRKSRFFDKLARAGGSMSLRAISKNHSISESCGRKWKEQWLKMDSIAKRKTRLKFAILGRKSKVTKSVCKMLCAQPRNSVRKQPYNTQITFYKIAVGLRQLQRKLKEYAKGVTAKSL
ncbi:hypothetical protein BJ878DRAFT_102705 [Calycina marina]|uniref:Uncharacterized protein n=1 Tax=Calycina marina TaxID=1763456 RepID=A0A9P8CEI8_9HELO|nr:hypothetical protein BJ878DRAFT_102705 [Calycina marina]